MRERQKKTFDPHFRINFENKRGKIKNSKSEEKNPLERPTFTHYALQTQYRSYNEKMAKNF